MVSWLASEVTKEKLTDPLDKGHQPYAQTRCKYFNNMQISHNYVTFIVPAWERRR